MFKFSFVKGLKIGERILKVNNEVFKDITHAQAVVCLKSAQRLTMFVAPLGQMPGGTPDSTPRWVTIDVRSQTEVYLSYEIYFHNFFILLWCYDSCAYNKEDLQKWSRNFWNGGPQVLTNCIHPKFLPPPSFIFCHSIILLCPPPLILLGGLMFLTVNLLCKEVLQWCLCVVCFSIYWVTSFLSMKLGSCSMCITLTYSI